MSSGKDVGKRVCLPSLWLPCCLSESWSLLRQPSSPGLEWLPPFLHTGFSFLVVILPYEAKLHVLICSFFPLLWDPLKWLCERRGSAWAAVTLGHVNRRCDNILMVWSSSAVLMCLEEGCFPHSEWWCFCSHTVRRHSGFPCPSALILAFTFLVSLFFVNSETGWCSIYSFDKLYRGFLAGLADIALMSLPWLCLGWRKTITSLSVSPTRGLSSTHLSFVLITRTFYVCVKRKCPMWFYLVKLQKPFGEKIYILSYCVHDSHTILGFR